MQALENIPIVNPKRGNGQAYVYLISSPSGKHYVGQTTKSPEKRWAQHQKAAKTMLNQCVSVERAIRKYGDDMDFEVLVKCPEYLVDFLECAFIRTYDSLRPNGYNLRDGGDGGCTDEMRESMRVGNNKKLAKKKVANTQHAAVKYVVYYTETNKHGTKLEGYRVSDHPNGRPKTFADSSLSIDEKYKLAVEYKLFLDAQTTYYDEREKIPKYMTKYRENGYKVRKPGFAGKFYGGQNKAENYKQAYLYLRSICTEAEIQTVFKNAPVLPN